MCVASLRGISTGREFVRSSSVRQKDFRDSRLYTLLDRFTIVARHVLDGLDTLDLDVGQMARFKMRVGAASS
jgi:hypothetical protein